MILEKYFMNRPQRLGEGKTETEVDMEERPNKKAWEKTLSGNNHQLSLIQDPHVAPLAANLKFFY